MAGYRPIASARGISAASSRYPQARFVLMHIAYPYSDELVAPAKHYPNVYVDLRWAWRIDPWAARNFGRRMIHAVPINKLFVFGGDTLWPAASVAYAEQARECFDIDGTRAAIGRELAGRS